MGSFVVTCHGSSTKIKSCQRASRSLQEKEQAPEDGADERVFVLLPPVHVQKTRQASTSLHAKSARGRGGAATAHVLAAPSELAHGPLLDQAAVAPMVPSIAVIRQRGRRRGRRWWRRRWAGFALRAAAEGLLALRPALLPV